MWVIPPEILVAGEVFDSQSFFTKDILGNCLVTVIIIRLIRNTWYRLT